MAVIKCENGHFYDNSKFEKCPHCDRNNLETTVENSVSIEKETVCISVGNHNDDGKTVGVYNFSEGTQLLAGWLVCTEGIVKGKDFKIYHGWNRIGRNMDMRIYIADDMKISDKEHAAVVYDNKSNKFFIVNQFASLTYLNSTLVEDSVELNSGDRIKVGDTELTFIAFCTEERKW